MRYVRAIEFTIQAGRMQEFTNAIQQWERHAFHHADAPERSEVLVDEDDPSRLLMTMRFTDHDHAERFEAAGHPVQLVESIRQCCRDEIHVRRFALYYAVGESGPSAIFGESPRPA